MGASSCASFGSGTHAQAARARRPHQRDLDTRAILAGLRPLDRRPLLPLRHPREALARGGRGARSAWVQTMSDQLALM